MRHTYFREVSQLIFLLVTYLKEEKKSGVSGLILENTIMRILSDIRQKSTYELQLGNNHSVLFFLCLISYFSHEFKNSFVKSGSMLDSRLGPGDITGLCDTGISLYVEKFLYAYHF